MPADYRKRIPRDLPDPDDLSKKEARDEVETVREALRFHDHRYYVEADPAVSDAAYDRLFAYLQALEDAHQDLHDDDSPTRRVGGEPVEALGKIEHVVPLLSLDATLDAEGVQAFLDRLQEAAKDLDGAPSQVVLEPKFDGLSVELVYEDGRLAHGSTRGDGRVGEDITENLRTLRSVPLRLRGEPPPRLAVRGEVYLPLEAFHAVNKQRLADGDDAFANPRNAAAGTVRQLDPRRVARVPLEATFYELLHASDAAPEDHWSVLEALRAWGLRVDPRRDRGVSLADVQAFHARMADGRDELPFEVDGITLKADHRPLRDAMGDRSRSPRWALAWKFPPREEETVLRDIVVQVGRTGVLTPVALLDPVDVGGATVSRATLHNEAEVVRRGAKPGTRVQVVRAGDVIPEVVGPVGDGPDGAGDDFEYALPDACPSCGAGTVREGAYVVCPAGLQCPAQRKARIVHYGSRHALDIDGLGERTVASLLEADRIKDVADLYHLDPGEVAGLDRFARRSAKNLVKAIQDRRQPSLDRFVFALGIRGVGQRVARDLAQAFGSLDALAGADEEALRDVAGIGDETAASVAHFFRDDANQGLLQRLRNAGVEPEPMTEAGAGGRLEGVTVVFTGALDGFTRDEAKAAVERLGGRVPSSISGNTDYVVAGKDPGSKRDDAKKHGVRILDEADFKRLLADGVA